ncbi:hypothetical protein GCM10010525_03960 [Glutamicibacter bergerei]
MKAESAWFGSTGGNQQTRARLRPVTPISGSNHARTAEYGGQNAFHAIEMAAKHSSAWSARNFI